MPADDGRLGELRGLGPAFETLHRLDNAPRMPMKFAP
jgi:hypothetical protein